MINGLIIKHITYVNKIDFSLNFNNTKELLIELFFIKINRSFFYEKSFSLFKF